MHRPRPCRWITAGRHVRMTIPSPSADLGVRKLSHDLRLPLLDEQGSDLVTRDPSDDARRCGCRSRRSRAGSSARKSRRRARGGQSVVRGHVAALTRDELEWLLDRPAGDLLLRAVRAVAALGPGADGPAVGDTVWALTPFEPRRVAADYAAVPSGPLCFKPRTSTTSTPRPDRGPGSALAGRSNHGGLEGGATRADQRCASGGVGRLAPRARGASWRARAHDVRGGGRARRPRSTPWWRAPSEVGGGAAAGGKLSPSRRSHRSMPLLRRRPKREQLAELGAPSSRERSPPRRQVFELEDTRAAFERVGARKRGKVVLEVGAAD